MVPYDFINNKLEPVKRVLFTFQRKYFPLKKTKLNRRLETKINNKENTSSIADLPSLAHDNSPEVARKRGCLEACVMQKMGLVRKVSFYLA